MTDSPAPSVTRLLAELHAFRVAHLAAELGTGQWELPYPTIVVIDSRGVVTFADVHPDWLVRTEAPAVIDAVRALVQVPA